MPALPRDWITITQPVTTDRKKKMKNEKPLYIYIYIYKPRRECAEKVPFVFILIVKFSAQGIEKVWGGMGSESRNRYGNGCGGEGGSGELVAAEKEMVQCVKEIVNCTECEIYAALEECDMDVNRAVEMLLSQGFALTLLCVPSVAFVVVAVERCVFLFLSFFSFFLSFSFFLFSFLFYISRCLFGCWGNWWRWESVYFVLFF